ncbi:MAG: hypothetical protein A3K67_01340 [Euryarchaeota archaeon RBG_16_62_10]|nr:MAG: hypothetical protein A3K67_01340 [Euryarchaeota archaeon RBG_16_62_10]
MDQKEHRIALKFAYDGTQFFGFQRQPGRSTVEGSLVTALEKVGAIRSPRECGYRSSSRTDSGVSALGNVVSFLTAFDTGDICAATNSELENVWAYSAVDVPEAFNPRAARQRWYRYHLPRTGQDLKLMEEIARRFVGVHDFSGHARKDKRNPMRKIASIDISESGMFHAIDFRAESFLWNMVRRIVWMMNEGGSGRMDMASIGPEAQRMPRRVGLSPPEYLVLMDIDCGIEFPVDARAAVQVARLLERRIRESAMKLRLEQGLAMRLSFHPPPGQY